MASILLRNPAKPFTVCLGDVVLLSGGTLGIVSDIFRFDSPEVTRHTAELVPGAHIGLCYDTIDGPVIDGGATRLTAMVTGAYSIQQYKAGEELPAAMVSYLTRNYIQVSGYPPISLEAAADLFFASENLAWYETATASEVAA